MLSTVVDFLLSQARYEFCEFIGINTAPSYKQPVELHLLYRCLPAAIVLWHTIQGMQLVFFQLHLVGVSWLFRAKWWPSWKAQTMTVQAATATHLLTSLRWTRNRKDGTLRKRCEEEMKWERAGRTDPHWDLCHVPLRSKQNGERRERGKMEEDAKIEQVSRVKFQPFPPD